METRKITAVATYASCQGAHTHGFIPNSSSATDLGGLYEQDEISKPIDNSGFTDEDIQEFDVDTETGEVKEENVIDINEL